MTTDSSPYDLEAREYTSDASLYGIRSLDPDSPWFNQPWVYAHSDHPATDQYLAGIKSHSKFGAQVVGPFTPSERAELIGGSAWLCSDCGEITWNYPVDVPLCCVCGPDQENCREGEEL